MPIDTATLIKTPNNVAQTRWTISAIDTLGTSWTLGPFMATEAEAEARRVLMITDWPNVWNLAERDYADLLEFVMQGSVDDTSFAVEFFDYTNRDITEIDGEKYVYWYFGAGDREAALNTVWWMDFLKPNQLNAIANNLGLDGVTEGLVEQRIPTLKNALPWLDAAVEIEDPSVG